MDPFVSALQEIGNTCPWTKEEIEDSELCYFEDEVVPNMTLEQIVPLLLKQSSTINDPRFKVVTPEKGYLTMEKILESILVHREFLCELSFKKKWLDGYEMHPINILFHDVDHGRQIIELEEKRPGILDQLQLLFIKAKSDRRIQIILFLVLHENCDYLFLDPTTPWSWPQRPDVGLSPQYLPPSEPMFIGGIQLLRFDRIYERFFKRALDLNGLLPLGLRDVTEKEQIDYLNDCYAQFVSKVSEIFSG